MRIVDIAMLGILSLGAAPPSVAGENPRPCEARQLRLSVDGKDGQYDGMQKSGTELSIRNTGRECTLPSLPRIEFLDARGQPLPVARRAPIGMHPGPVMVPVRLAAGHRAAADLTWVSGPVYATNRQFRISQLRLSIGAARLRTRLTGVINLELGKPGSFAQSILMPVEGMAAG